MPGPTVHCPAFRFRPGDQLSTIDGTASAKIVSVASRNYLENVSIENIALECGDFVVEDGGLGADNIIRSLLVDGMELKRNVCENSRIVLGQSRQVVDSVFRGIETSYTEFEQAIVNADYNQGNTFQFDLLGGEISIFSI